MSRQLSRGIWAASALIALSLLFFSRNVLLFWGVKLALSGLIPGSHFEKTEWRNGALWVDHLRWGSEGHEGKIQAISLSPHWSYIDFRMIRPHLTFLQTDKPTTPYPLTFLLAPRVRTTIDKGILQIGETTYRFDFAPGIRALSKLAFEDKRDDFAEGPVPCESTYPDGHRRFARDLDPSEKGRVCPEMEFRKRSIEEIGTLRVNYGGKSPLMLSLSRQNRAFEFRFSLDEPDCTRLFSLSTLLFPFLEPERGALFGGVSCEGNGVIDRDGNLHHFESRVLLNQFGLQQEQFALTGIEGEIGIGADFLAKVDLRGQLLALEDKFPFRLQGEVIGGEGKGELVLQGREAMRSLFSCALQSEEKWDLALSVDEIHTPQLNLIRRWLVPELYPELELLSASGKGSVFISFNRLTPSEIVLDGVTFSELEFIDFPFADVTVSSKYQHQKWTSGEIRASLGHLEIQGELGADGAINYQIIGPFDEMLRAPAGADQATLIGSMRQTDLAGELTYRQEKIRFVWNERLSIKSSKMTPPLFQPILAKLGIELPFHGTLAVDALFEKGSGALLIHGEDLVLPLYGLDLKIPKTTFRLKTEEGHIALTSTHVAGEGFSCHLSADFTRGGDGDWGTKLLIGQLVADCELPNRDRSLLRSEKIVFDSAVKQCQFDLRVDEWLRVEGGELRWEDLLFTLECKGASFKGSKSYPLSAKVEKRGQEWRLEKLLWGKTRLAVNGQPNGKGIDLTRFEGEWEGISFRGKGSYHHGSQILTLQLQSLAGDLPDGKWTSSGKAVIGLTPFTASGEMDLQWEVRSPLLFYGQSEQKICWRLQGNEVAIERPFSFSGSLERKGERRIAGSANGAIYHLETQELKCPRLQLSIDPRSWHVWSSSKGAPTALAHLKLPEGVKGAIELRASPDQISFKGELRDFLLGYEDQQWLLCKTALSYERGIFKLKSKTKWEQLPVWIGGEVQCGPRPEGTVTLSQERDQEGIECDFRTTAAGIVWKRIRGSCSGLTLDLISKGASDLSGKITFNPEKLKLALPAPVRKGVDKLKCKENYELSGELFLPHQKGKSFHFEGTLRGEECELLGYRIQSLLSHIELSSRGCSLTGLQIEDPAFTAQIKEIHLKEGDLQLPLVQIHNLRPALLRRGDGKSMPQKPLIIKQLSLYHVRGTIGDEPDLQGEGRLHFISGDKKESSIFDEPIEMIKNLGLDPGLFTPVQGEIRFELKRDRFIIQQLENALSDGGRSEFFLAWDKQPPYVDLDGNLHVDLRVKQNVALKLGESFIVTIRGTLEKPRYGLR